LEHYLQQLTFFVYLVVNTP